MSNKRVCDMSKVSATFTCFGNTQHVACLQCGRGFRVRWWLFRGFLFAGCWPGFVLDPPRCPVSSNLSMSLASTKKENSNNLK